MIFLIDDLAFGQCQVFADLELGFVHHGRQTIVVLHIADELLQTLGKVLPAIFQRHFHRRGVAHQRVGGRHRIGHDARQQLGAQLITIRQRQPINPCLNPAAPGQVALHHHAVGRVRYPDRIAPALVAFFGTHCRFAGGGAYHFLTQLHALAQGDLRGHHGLAVKAHHRLGEVGRGLERGFVVFLCHSPVLPFRSRSWRGFPPPRPALACRR